MKVVVSFLHLHFIFLDDSIYSLCDRLYVTPIDK